MTAFPSRMLLCGALGLFWLIAGRFVPAGYAASLQTDFEHFVRDLGIATSVVPHDHRRSAPGSPWSAGVSGSAVEVPDRDYVDRVYGNEDPPDYFYVPRLHLGRRLGRWVRGSGFLSQDPENDLRIVGGTLEGSFRPVGPGPLGLVLRAVGTRTSAQRDYVIQGVTVKDFRVETYGGDGILGYGMGRYLTYVGYGILRVEGDARAPSSPVTLRGTSTSEERGFVGFSTQIHPIRTSLQLDVGTVRTLTLGLTVRF